MNIINNSQVLGSLNKDLVLNTLGKIYIRTGDRYYELNFLNKSQEVSELNNDAIEPQSPNSDIIITKTISNIEYPGDNKFIISLDGKFYITQNGKFKNVTPSTSTTTSTNKSTVGISLIEDMNIISRLYSDNLILDFSTGDITSETLKVNKIIAKSINAESINITDKDQFVSGFQKIYFGPEVSIMDIDVDDDFTYFTFTSDYDEPIFKVGSQVTNESESFIGEVVESTYEQIKVRILSGDTEGTDKIILKADSIQYDETWGSIYNKEHNLRVGIVTASGDYSHLEFIIVSSNVNITLKSGTFVKCDNDCTISTNIDSKSNVYDLKANTLYLLTDAICINLTNTTHYFKTKSEFESAKIKDSDIAFIKETEQIYYNGLYVGGKSSNQGLPDNFKIGTATNGALIVYKDGIWQPSYDFATYKYVDNKLNELLNNAPDALDTLGEIAAILQQNANSIGDLLLAVTELSKNKVSQENFDSEIDRINKLLLTLDSKSLFTLIDSKATWEALKEVESKLETYATKNYVAKLINNLNLNQYKEGIDNLSKSISKIQLDINEHSDQINDLEDKDASLFKTTGDLSDSQKELREEFNNLKLKFNEDALPGNNIGNIPVQLTEIENKQILVYHEESNTWINQHPSVDEMFEWDTNGNIHAKAGVWTDSFLLAGGLNENIAAIPIINELNDIENVTINNLQTGQVLIYDGSKWVNGEAGLNQNELSDRLKNYLSTDTNYAGSDSPGGAANNSKKFAGEDQAYYATATALTTVSEKLNSFQDKFDKMFQLTEDGVKVLYGLWTDSFLSAGGLNPNTDDISFASAISDLDDVSISNPSNGQILKYNGRVWVNDTIEVGSNYTLPKASNSALGGIKIGFSNTGDTKNYAVQLDANDRAYVNVPWTDNNTTYGLVGGYNTTGLIKNGSNVTNVTGFTACPIVSGVPYYKNTTYSTATSDTFGLVKIGYAENNQNYPVELSNGKMFVNVPWTDTNTTYTNGTGLSLSNGIFSLSKSGANEGDYGPSANVTGNNDTTMNIPYLHVDEYGRITSIQNKIYTAKNTTYTLSGLGGIGTITASGTSPLSLSATKSGTGVTISGSVENASASTSGVVSTKDQTFAGNKTFTGSVTTNDRFYDSSDIRLKNILSDLSDLSLDTILSIPRVRYKWKKDDSTIMIGTIAQPMVGKFDELLHTDDEGIYSVDYDSISVIALEGIAKVKSEVDILRERIEYLETEIEKLGGTI